MIKALPNLNFVKLFSGLSPVERSKLVRQGWMSALAILVLYAILRFFELPTSYNATFMGVPFYISMLTMIIVVIFWVDGYIYLQDHEIGLKYRSYAVVGVVIALAVLGSVALHELAHGIASTYYGNPIEIAGFSGWGAFVSPAHGLEEMTPWQQIVVALAGVAANYAIGIAAALVVLRHKESLFENTVQYIGVINVRLGRFNLIPLFYLFDGGKALDGFLRLFIENESTRSGIQPLIATLLIILYLYVYRPRFRKFEDMIAEM